MSRIQRIRQKILDRAYYLSSHAEVEMLDDRLERRDIENAILKGRIQKRLSKGVGGTKDREDKRYTSRRSQVRRVSVLIHYVTTRRWI